MHLDLLFVHWPCGVVLHYRHWNSSFYMPRSSVAIESLGYCRYFDSLLCLPFIFRLSISALVPHVTFFFRFSSNVFFLLLGNRVILALTTLLPHPFPTLHFPRLSLAAFPVPSLYAPSISLSHYRLQPIYIIFILTSLLWRHVFGERKLCHFMMFYITTWSTT